MAHDFMAQLRRDAAQLVEAADRSPARALFDGSASRELYVAFLQETWHYVRYTSSTLQFAGERLKSLGQHGWLADVLIEKSREERGHDLWALYDLAVLGVREVDIEGTSPSAAVAAKVAGFATKAGRFRRFGPNPRPDFSGDFHSASHEIKQERRST
jgi:hypothetical protein